MTKTDLASLRARLALGFDAEIDGMRLHGKPAFKKSDRDSLKSGFRDGTTALANALITAGLLTVEEDK